MGSLHIPEDKRLAIYWAQKNDGLTLAQLAHSFKVHISSVNRILREERAKKRHRRVITTNALAVRTETPSIPPAVPATQERKYNREGTGKYSHLYPDIVRLRAEGFGPKEIAGRIGTSAAVVGYYFKKIKNLEKLHRKEARMQINSQGVTQNGGPPQLSKDFRIGYASAELDRAIDGISTKLQLTPNELRSGFSRFLGSTAVRREPRPAN